jgi:hypothetical protein
MYVRSCTVEDWTLEVAPTRHISHQVFCGFRPRFVRNQRTIVFARGLDFAKRRVTRNGWDI